MSILLLSLSIAGILTILLKTDVVYAYLNIFPLSEKEKFALLLNAYEIEKGTGNYPNILFYWLEKFGARPLPFFFLKLVTCPYCAGFWLSLLSSLLILQLQWVFAVYFLSLCWYFLLDKVTRIN